MLLIPKILSRLFSKKTPTDHLENQVPDAPKNGFWKRLGNNIRNIFTPSNYGIAGSNKIDSTVAKEAKEVALDSWALVKDTVPFTMDTEQRLAPGLEANVRARGRYFFTLGFEDGIKGIRNEASVLEVAKGEARNLVEYVKAISLGKTKALESEKKVRQSILGDEKQRYTVARDYLERITHYYQHEPRNFAVLLGFIYFLVASALIFADIPLAKKLTIEGFYLKDDYKSFSLVIGLALCTVYIKIYYDDYVATPLGTWVRQFKNIPGITKSIKNRVKNEEDKTLNMETLNTENQSEGDENDVQFEKDKRGVKREYLTKFVIKTALLFFTLGTIIVLGIFRYQNIGPKEQQVLINYAEWLFKNNLAGSLSEGIGKALFWTQTAFILITLIFPIIGGICLSLSFNIFQNRWRLGKANDDFDKTRQLHVIALAKLNNVEQEYEDFKNIFDEWKGDKNGSDHLDFFSKVFMAYYRLGFDDGYREPDYYDKNADIYTQVEQMRRKVIARKVYNLLAPQ